MASLAFYLMTTANATELRRSSKVYFYTIRVKNNELVRTLHHKKLKLRSLKAQKTHQPYIIGSSFNFLFFNALHSIVLYKTATFELLNIICNYLYNK